MEKNNFVCFITILEIVIMFEIGLKNNLKAVIHLAAIVPIKDVNSNKKAKDVNF